jgi:membrane-associated phospholipid phosphatase
MWLFFTAYFHVMRNPAYPVLTLPLTAVDLAIPFVPQALAVYLSLWFYVGIPAGLAASRRDALIYGAWAAALCTSGLLIFHFWPTAVPRMPIDLASHPAFAVLQGVDAAGNACPSLHVASAVFAAAWISRILRDVQAPLALDVVNVLWCLAIAWSTVAVRQHVALDVLGGLALGALFALLSRRRRSPA